MYVVSFTAEGIYKSTTEQDTFPQTQSKNGPESNVQNFDLCVLQDSESPLSLSSSLTTCEPEGPLVESTTVLFNCRVQGLAQRPIKRVEIARTRRYAIHKLEAEGLHSNFSDFSHFSLWLRKTYVKSTLEGTEDCTDRGTDERGSVRKEGFTD